MTWVLLFVKSEDCEWENIEKKKNKKKGKRCESGGWLGLESGES